MPNNTIPIRVVVIEDDTKIAQLLVDYLVLENYQAIVFHNGQQAFEYLQNNTK
jgi:DNA-binding response OmpR family regulator